MAHYLFDLLLEPMSWIEKELKRRAAASAKTAGTGPGRLAVASQQDSESARIAELWAKFQSANNALPEEIRLVADAARPSYGSGEDAHVAEWRRARNGASLGCAANGIRYTWPERNAKKSNNFWIRWNVEERRYLVTQRIGSSAPATTATYAFDASKTDDMLKRMVLCVRVKPKSLQKKRFWLF